MKINGWDKTDSRQWTKKIGDNEYLVVEVWEADPDVKLFNVSQVSVDLTDYTDSELETNFLSAYGYRSLQEVKDAYPDEWGGVVAECIAETILLTSSDILCTSNEEGCLRFADRWIRRVKHEPVSH